MDHKKSGDLEKIPGLVASGKITREEAVKVLAQELYLSPYRFGLAAYDEDFRSEVVLDFLRKALPVLARYEPERSCFGAYIFAFVQGLILTQKRNQIRGYITDSSVKQFLEAEEKDRQSQETGTMQISSTAPPEYEAAGTQNIWKTLSLRCRSVGASNAKTALILALKSSYYLPAEQIDSVSSYCSLNSAELHRIIIELNSLLYTKINRRNLIIERRNNAYYFHRKYGMQLKYGNQDKAAAAGISEKYNRQTRNWQNKNSLLQNSRYRVCPTNKMIADLLGICERQVSYYINRAKELSDENKLIV